MSSSIYDIIVVVVIYLYLFNIIVLYTKMELEKNERGFLKYIFFFFFKGGNSWLLMGGHILHRERFHTAIITYGEVNCTSYLK